MTALQFVEKWRDSSLGERQGAQSHFLDLCDLLGEPKPTDPESYCFERGAEKVGGGDGWADVAPPAPGGGGRGRGRAGGTAVAPLASYPARPPSLPSPIGIACDPDIW